jgi:hypothetical protein
MGTPTRFGEGDAAHPVDQRLVAQKHTRQNSALIVKFGLLS